MEGDRPLVHEIEDPLDRVDGGVCGRAAAPRHLDASDQRRKVRRGVLLAKALRADPVGMTFECQRRSAEEHQHLVTDPLLPAELAPPEWPATEFRTAYAAYSARYQASLRAFFRSQLSALG